MKKIPLGIICGICAGVLDVIPMVIQKLTWDANLSAFLFWVVAGFVIASSNLRLRGITKGIVVSLAIFLPVAPLIAAQDPFTLVPVLGMNLILGSFTGLIIGKFGK